MRRLIIRERTLPAGMLAEYLARWSDLVAGAEAEGAHAWVFRDVSDDGRFIEFIEFSAAALSPSVTASHALLDDLAPAVDRGAWEEWKRDAGI